MYEMEHCFQKQKTAWGKHIFSPVLRVVYIYVLVFNNFKIKRFFFLRNNEAAFFVISSLMPHSLALSSLIRFCGNDYIAKMKTIIAVTILLITTVLFAIFEILAFV